MQSLLRSTHLCFRRSFDDVTRINVGGFVINCAEFFVDWFRGIDFVGGCNLPIPIGIEGRR